MDYPILTALQQSPIDPRDHIASLPIITVLPTSVDMKPDVFEVENQGSFGSCTANAGCSALEMIYKRRKTPVDLSRLYLYYYTRKFSGITGDLGAYPRDIGKALKEYGVCLETTWEYTAEKLELEPSVVATTEAVQFKIASYEQLIGDKVLQIKNAVAQGIPVLLTMVVHNSFFSVSGEWHGQTWDTVTSPTNTVAGLHEVLVIGYDDSSQRLLVENSWGPSFGDGGFFGMPYSIANSSAVGELWILNANDVVPPSPPKPKSTNLSQIVIVAIVAIIAFALSQVKLY